MFSINNATAVIVAYNKQEAVCMAASEISETASYAAHEDEPEFPVVCTTHHQWNNTIHRMDREGIENAVSLMFMSTERAEATCKARHKLLDRWEADCEAVELKHKVGETQSAANA